MPEPLTDLERQILDYLIEYLRENTYQPSIREIGRRFDIKSTKTVSEYLQSLAEKGWVERDPSRSRGVRLLGLDLGGHAQPGIAGVPTMVVDEPLAAGADRRTVLLTTGDEVWASRTGDVALIVPTTAPPPDEATVVVRDGEAVYLARVARDGRKPAARDAAGRTRTLGTGAGDTVELLGLALGFWRPAAPSTQTHTISAGESAS